MARRPAAARARENPVSAFVFGGGGGEETGLEGVQNINTLGSTNWGAP